jgi:hypothetical protein
MNEQTELIVQKILLNCNNKDDIENFNVYLQSYYKSQKESQEELSTNDTIINNFFDIHSIYFNKTSKLFFHHTENNIILLNEDNILHYVMEFLTHNKIKKLNIDQKSRLTSKICRKIKENSVYDVIPETDIIQFILNCLFPTIFNNRDIAKIFLIILGNILMKKNMSDIIVFTKPNIKPFLNQINKTMSMYFCNINIFNFIKFKYTTDHEMKDKWTLHCNDINYNIFNFNEQFFINLICVAIYYSNRYNDVYSFIYSEDCDKSIIEIFLYFQRNTKDNIIQDFTNKLLVKKSNQCINEKELIFLWKKFTSDNDLFVTPFTSINDFISLLFESNNCSSSSSQNKVLYGYYSLDTPNIDNFKKFWNQHFYSDDEETYFELNEIFFIINKHCKNINMDNNKIRLILQTLLDYDIISNKYIHNLNCKLWNKKKEINEFLAKHKYDIKNVNIQEIYKNYNRSFENKNDLKIGKKYFENYIKQLKS